MARILIITLVFAPDGVSTSTIVSELAQDLQKKGHTLEVLTTYPHFNNEPEARSRQPLKRCLKGLYYRSTYENIPVWHTAIFSRGKGSQAGRRMLGYLMFHFISLVLGLFRLGSQDVVLVVSPPLTSGLVGWLLARIKRAKLVYNVQELYPETFISTGVLSAESRTAQVLRWFEQFVYQTSDALIVICNAFKDYIEAKNISPQKIFVIPNFVDIQSLYPASKDNLLAQEHGLTERYVVLYAGNIGMTQSFDTLLDAAQKLMQYPDIRILIVGDGVQREYIANKVKQLQLQNVLMLPYQPRSRVNDIYATADLGLVPLMAGTAKTTLPSKLYTIMASGTPALVSVDMDSDIVDTVKAANGGVAVPPDDSEKLVTRILDAYKNRAQFDEYGKNARAYVEENFSRQVISEKYDELIKSLVTDH